MDDLSTEQIALSFFTALIEPSMRKSSQFISDRTARETFKAEMAASWDMALIWEEVRNERKP